uniref:Venom peptide HtC2Tx1 n=1 Tax=Hadogenes troglodytes TaxID=1577150 RepID=A0A1B3IIZ3_9SCOR|nr:venom peptide HtC2Tx1 [Hadogenes troglodytes]
MKLKTLIVVFLIFTLVVDLAIAGCYQKPKRRTTAIRRIRKIIPKARRVVKVIKTVKRIKRMKRIGRRIRHCITYKTNG